MRPRQTRTLTTATTGTPDGAASGQEADKYVPQLLIVKSLDHAMSVVGLALYRFLTRVRMTRLLPGQRRYKVSFETLPQNLRVEGQAFRYCVDVPCEGMRYLEAPAYVDDLR